MIPSASTRRFSRLSQPSTKFRGSAVPFAVVFLVPLAAPLDVPLTRDRPVRGCLKLLDGFTASKVEALLQLRFDPWQERMAFAQIELAEQ